MARKMEVPFTHNGHLVTKEMYDKMPKVGPFSLEHAFPPAPFGLNGVDPAIAAQRQIQMKQYAKELEAFERSVSHLADDEFDQAVDLESCRLRLKYDICSPQGVQKMLQRHPKLASLVK